MREVVVSIRCDACEEEFLEDREGDNSVVFTIRGAQREIDLCDDCIAGTFLQEARPVKGKAKSAKPFLCQVVGCGKTYTTRGRLDGHTLAAHGVKA